VLGADAFRRIADVSTHLEGWRKRIVAGRHWYLNQVGVHPQRRGRGLGRSLLRPVLDAAAADGLPCYLETFAPQNLDFYEGLGFDVVVEEFEPGSGLQFWVCVRRPPSQPILNPA
jgi:ribosomal protein S18 acetylase RimI-like enzyme